MALSKKFFNKLSILITLFILLSLSGCLSEWHGNLAKIVISFGSANRAAYDPNDSNTHQSLEHKIVLTSATETKNFNIKGGTTFEAHVAPGDWNVLVHSYSEDGIYAAGSKDVVLKIGQDNRETIDMYQAHLVTFDSNDGSPVEEQIIIHDKFVNKPNPTRPGYSFEGWYYLDDNNTGTLFDFKQTITKNFILSAKWEIITKVPGDTLAAKLEWLSSNAVHDQTYDIPVSQNESLAPQNLYYRGKTIGINLSGENEMRTISLSGNGSLFTIGSNVTLQLNEKITLKGHTSNNASLITINSGGSLIMNKDSKITENSNIDGWQAGVYIQENAKFTMNGGEISYNIAQGCGGVKVEGTFIMEDGNISYNEARGNSGGGVWIQGGTFTMNGGIISFNTAEGEGGGEGGGVHMYDGIHDTNPFSGTFTMTGGEISNNEAWGSGGVSIHHHGNFTMSDTAKISGNIATEWDGGGVKLHEGTTFTMNGGEISGNKAKENGGGGVLVEGTFTMNSGKIYGNTALYGGGVRVWNGIFDKKGNGGTIYNNIILDDRMGGTSVSADSEIISGFFKYRNTEIKPNEKLYYDGTDVSSAEGFD